MEDAEGAAQSKKRIAGRQLTKDNPGDDDDDVPEGEMGTFKKATDEVLSTRRIVKVRRHSQQTTSSPNPFAGIQFVPTTDSSVKTTTGNVGSEAANGKILLEEEGHIANQEINGKDTGTDTEALLNDQVAKAATEDQGHVSVAAVDNGNQIVYSVTAAENKNDAGVGGQSEKEGIILNREEDREEAGKEGEEETGKETEGAVKESVTGSATSEGNKEEIEKENQENDDKGKHAPSVSFSSFQQLSSSQNAFTGLAGSGFSSSVFSFGPTSSEGSVFGPSSGPAFGLKGDTPLFSFGTGNSDKDTSAASLGSTANGGSNKASLQEVPVETGEENENSVFTADAILFEYIESAWKERGKGELKVNISTTGNERARLVMRARGNYRLILNARLYPDMSLKNMEKKGVTFACINTAGEGKDALATFALKFRDSSAMEDFCESVNAHKGKKAVELKTPENSP